MFLDVFDTFKNIFTGNWGGALDSFLNLFKRTWNLLISFLSTAITYTIQLHQKVFGFLGFDSLVKGGDEAIKMVGKVAESFKASVPSITGSIDKLTNTFDGFTFGGAGRTVTPKKKNGPSETELKDAFETARKQFASVGDKALSFGGSVLGSIIGADDKQEIKSQFDKLVNNVKSVFGANEEEFAEVLSGVLMGKDFGANLQKRFDNIKINVIPKTLLYKAQRDGEIFGEAISVGIKDAIMAGFDGFADLLTGAFASAFGGGKFNAKAVAGGLLSTLGDIAIRLGKTALAIGLGIEAINVSLSTLSPAAAIGAGIGLIALGAALKGAGSAISGNSGRNSSPAGGSGGNSAPNFRQGLSLNINGSLVAEGTQLKAVLTNTDLAWS